MTKAQEMLAKAGFPDTAAGRAAFHKQYPTPDSFFQVHGSSDTEMYKAGGGIHIKPSKRGTFTAAATKHGKSVQAFASQVLANKENYSPAMVKKANFARNAAKWKHEDGGVVDAYQLMGMPTPPMYGDGGWHPTLSLSAENNPNKVNYLNSPYYQDVQSIDNRNTLSGTLPIINNKLNLTGSYGTNNNYTVGAEYSLGDILSGGSKGPSRRFDNPDIAHKGRSFIDTYGHVRAGVTNNGERVLPYFGGDFTAAHQMGRTKGPNGLRQPKGTVYTNLELNQVEDPKNDLYVNNNYMRANIGGSYNFGKGLGVYGEAGYDVTRKAPRAEIGLKKTFADGGYIPSYNFGHVLSKNNTYKHGYANGGNVYTQANNYNNWLIDPNYIDPNNSNYISKHDLGGTLEKAGNTWKNSMLLGVDNLASIVNTDIIGDKRYSGNTFFGDSPDTFTDLSHYTGEIANSVVPTALNFVAPGAGTALSAGQLLADRFIPDDEHRLQSKSGQTAAKIGLGLDLAGAAVGVINPGGLAAAGVNTAANAGSTAADVASGVGSATASGANAASGIGSAASSGANAANAATTAANAANAAKVGTTVATTAPKTLDTVSKVGKGLKYTNLALNAYDTAQNPDSDWKDYASLGLDVAGTVGGDLSSAGKSGLSKSVEGIDTTIDTRGYMSPKAIEDMNKYAKLASTGDQLSKASRAGRAGMSLYNTGENIDKYGLNTQTGLQAMNAVGQGIGAASNYSDNQNLQNFSKYYDTAANTANFGYNLYNTIDSQTEDPLAYLSLLPQGLSTGMQISNTFGNQRPGQFVPSSLGKNDMGGTIQAIGGITGSGKTMGTFGGSPFDNYQQGQQAYNAINEKDPVKMLNTVNGMGRMGPGTGFSYHAMGGAVNAPNMMKYGTGGSTTYDLSELSKQYNLLDNSRLLNYNLVGTDKFAEGGNPQMTMGNVERGELLTDKDGKIVTKYMGGGMVPHPADGSQDPNGNVPLQEGQFIIPTKYAKDYEIAVANNDKLRMNSIKNTTEKVKAEKEAKEKAQQAMAEQIMTAKYGGMVGQYGYGGGIMKYDGGSNIPPIDDLMVGAPSYNYYNNYNVSPIMGEGFYNPEAASNEYQNLENINNYIPPYNLKNLVKLPTISNLNPNTGYGLNEGKYLNAIPYRVEPGENWGSNVVQEQLAPVTSTSLTPDEIAKLKQARKDKYINAAVMAGMVAPAAYNILNGVFGKRTHLTPETVAPLQWTNLSGEAQRRALKSAYATSKYNTPVGSGYLAERAKRAADYMEAVSKLEQDIANTNAQGRMAVAEKNAAISGSNADRRMQAQLYDRQSDAAAQGATATGVSNLAQIANAYRQENTYKEALNMSTGLKKIGGKWYFTDPDTKLTQELST